MNREINYREMSVTELNKLVSHALEPEGISPIFNLVNADDWTSLIKKLTPIFSIDIGEDYIAACYGGGITMEDIYEPYDDSIGRAMSICYLRSIELLEEVKVCEAKNKKDEEACYSEGFNSAIGDKNPYVFTINPWAHTPWRKGHDARWSV